MTCMLHVSNMTCLMHVKKSICAKDIKLKEFVLNLSMFKRMLTPPHLGLHVRVYTDEHFGKRFLIPNCFTRYMHTCMSCNMHVVCMENVPNPYILHETCMLHACRYKWNLHITCTKVSACHHLNYACNMHVICTRFRIGLL